MKIQAISSNTNFKGHYTDKTRENNNNWLIEYRPYSWEKNNTSKMDVQTDIDIMSSSLPDNEKIYIDKDGRKSAKDILGTEFYYEYENGPMRKIITERPAMSREESLNIYNTKLKKFIKMKENKKHALLGDVKSMRFFYDHHVNSYITYSADAKKSRFSREFSLNHSHSIMDKAFHNVQDFAMSVLSNFEKSSFLDKTIDTVKMHIQNNDMELGLIQNARKANNFIDISRRDIYDPNKALWLALQDVNSAKNKVVALPHKTTLVSHLIEKACPNGITKDMPKKVIELVDFLITKRI